MLRGVVLVQITLTFIHAEAASVGDSSSSAVLRKGTQRVPASLPPRKDKSKKSHTGKLCFVFL